MSEHRALSPPIAAGGLADQVDAVMADQPVPGAGDDMTWSVVLDDTDPARRPRLESLFTVADGVVGTRGTLEEDGSSSVAGAFAAGLYAPAEGAAQQLLPLPGWATLLLASPLEPGERCLDLRRGVLWRTVVDADGAVLRTARWACLSRPGTEVMVADGPLDALGVQEEGPELVRVEHRSPYGRLLRLVETQTDRREPADGSPIRLSLSRIATFVPGTDQADRGPDDGTGHSGAGPGLERLGSRAHRAAVDVGVAGLAAEQRQWWEQRWRRADIEVVGDRELTLAARFALFQLAGVATTEGEAAVGARGLTGPAYAGHVFWDSDVFVLPALASTDPPAARAMLEYRIRRLGAARRRARAGGYDGARFPWESAADGEDVTPRVGADALGRPVAIRTGELEEHITADVAWAAWHFAAVTGQWDFLQGPGRPLLVETARFWASRIRLDRDGRGHIDGVIGPDEYHEDVDDNAFTNVMAAWNLRRGAEVVERTVPTVPAERAEAARWVELAASLVTGYNPVTGRHAEFAGYDELEPLVAADLGPVPLAGDLVLGRERLSASQIVKQADVVMLHHLVPDVMPPGSRQADVDYYLARTTHGSSLSPAVHAAVLARAGRIDQAANALDLARRIDLEDLTGTTGGGLHLGALGGLWQALVFGFGGMRVSGPGDRALVLDPKLPGHWEELRIRLTWRGQVLHLRCRDDAVHVGCREPSAVVVGSGRAVTVEPPGCWVERAAAEEEARGDGHTR